MFVAPAPSFRLSRWVFLRLLAIIYLAAFVSFAVQMDGLIGQRGILPAGAFLDAVGRQVGGERVWLVPTLAWLGASDAGLRVLCWGGALAALLAVLDLAPMLTLALAWIAYLSLVNVGQVFTAFQWDSLLLETGFLAVLLAPARLRPGLSGEPAPLAGVLWLFRLLVFRLVFSSGLVKLTSGDAAWRDLTALHYHYETQPLPTPLAWYAHQLSAETQDVSVLVMFALELIVPFFVFGPRWLRLLGAVLMVLLQLAIMATGNYAFFNLNTLALVLLLVDDRVLARVLPRGLVTRAAQAASRPDRRRFVIAPLVVILLVLGTIRLAGTVAGYRALPDMTRAVVGAVEPFRVVNPYGLFAVMTTTRPEISVEGSRDGIAWRAYEFRYKPGDPARRPRWVAPHQPRLDWQMWFAALGPYQASPWFVRFAVRLLEGSPEVLALLAGNPFPDAPPLVIRATVREYRFSAPDGAGWWTPGAPRLYLPGVQLKR